MLCATIGLVLAATLAAAGTAATGAAPVPAGSANPNPMPVGVDDAGARKPIYADASAQAAFEAIGFDFFMYHFWGAPSIQDVDQLIGWAEKGGHGFLLNGENSKATKVPGDPALYRRPGNFWQPSAEVISRCLASPHFLGFCFDECEHWTTNGVWVTAGKAFAPQFYDAEGETIPQAYAGNLHNLQVLMSRAFPGFAERARRPGRVPVVGTENVFPILQHLFARVGMVQMPKLLKETVTPVTAAMAMGAAKQYGVQHWTSVDLWGSGAYPGHSPEALESALLFSYWTGAERTYIENFNYKGSLYSVEEDQVVLSPHGETARRFIREYLPRHPRHIRFEEFAPETILVRFPDSDWGQENPGPWIQRHLYGARNLSPDADTRNWLKVWHVITHGTLPPVALNYNTRLGIPYRVFFPANNVAVYDHLASDPALYGTARLVFLTGKEVSPACLETLRDLSRKGLTVVSTTRLAPPEMRAVGEAGYAVHPTGAGRWIVTDDVTLPAVRQLLAPLLGSPEELRYVFGRTEVVFTAPDDPNRLQVTLRERE